MLDFEIKQETLPVIKINFDEMKAALSEKMEQYKGIIVTEEGLSTCKADQKQLAGLRNKIDTFRKDKKKEMSEPITQFESQCKELISLVEKAEQPIKNGIKIFDDKKREEKRQKALELIQESVQAHELNEKYASKLTVLDKYMNLSASVKSIKEDIEQRVYALVQEQAKEEEIIQIVKTTIENVNKEINTPIKYEDFKNLVERGYSVPEVINRINQMAEKIKLAENPPKEAPQPTAVPEPVEVPTAQYYTKPLQEPIKVDEPLYFVSFKITGNVHQTAAIGQFLRDNKIKYEVLNKGAVK
ncbi:DUF1351 domain-containing protein [Clostridium neuense]|uniref:DUF1351 domain-containing protein n=1 Tax=Clostridium neuense TaxID=1728934 RepID=A0ABW8TGI5_9CLOT